MLAGARQRVTVATIATAETTAMAALLREAVELKASMADTIAEIIWIL